MLLGGPAESTHHTTSTARQPSHTHHTHHIRQSLITQGQGNHRPCSWATRQRGWLLAPYPTPWIPVCVACVARARRLPSRARGFAPGGGRASRRLPAILSRSVRVLEVSRTRCSPFHDVLLQDILLNVDVLLHDVLNLNHVRGACTATIIYSMSVCLLPR